MRIETTEYSTQVGEFIVYGTRKELQNVSSLGEKGLASVIIEFNPNNLESILNFLLLFSPDKIDNKFQSYIQHFFAKSDSDNYDSPIPLFNHQKSFIRRALNQKKILNASEQGTGKTYATLAFVKYMNISSVVIVCPKSLLYQWRDSCNKMFMMQKIRVSDEYKTGMEIEKNTISIVGYEYLVKLRNIQNVDMFVLDESSAIKNPATNRAQWVLENVRSEYVHLLNGTPIGNDVGELYTQLSLLGATRQYLNHTDFTATFAHFATKYIAGRSIMKPYGIKNAERLIELITPFYYRIQKQSCLDLPPKYETEFPTFSLPFAIRNELRRLRRAGLTDTDLSNLAVRMIREQQLVGGFDYPLEEKYIEINPKIAFVDEVVTQSKGIIIWCKYNAEVEGFYARYKDQFRCARITGESVKTNKELEEIKTKFNAGEIDVLILQIQKMCAGHDLIGGNINIYYSCTWSYRDYEQSRDRTHRIGQTKGVRYIVPILEGTVDQQIQRALEERKNVADVINFNTEDDDENEM